MARMLSVTDSNSCKRCHQEIDSTPNPQANFMVETHWLRGMIGDDQNNKAFKFLELPGGQSIKAIFRV